MVVIVHKGKGYVNARLESGVLILIAANGDEIRLSPLDKAELMFTYDIK